MTHEQLLDEVQLLRERNAELQACIADHEQVTQERERALAELRHSENKYRALIQQSPDPVFVSRIEDFVFVEVNDRACADYGYSREEFLTMEIFDIEQKAPLRQIVRDFYDATAVGQVVEVEGVNRRKDGSTFPVHVKLTKLDEALALAVSRDITERRRAEDALRQLQKMELVGQLTGGIAHDFNNLLTVILTNLDLIAGELPTNEAPPTELRDARDAALGGAELIKRLVALTRREPLRFQSVDLTQLLDRFVATARRLFPETIEIQCVSGESCPPVMADPIAVEQILLNLATNARDAMPSGGTFRIEAKTALGSKSRDIRSPGFRDGYVCVSVGDTGVGMDEHTKQRIHEPFFTTKAHDRGTGLGMAMVYSLVEQHKGSIDVDSQPGHGTRINIHFPVAALDAPATVSETEATDVPGGTETVLLVEDEAPLRRAAKRVLERYGYVVLAAPDGQDALRIFRAQSAEIDLVITDVVMPRMSGPDLCRAIEGEAPMTKVMFMSGYSSRSEWTRVGLEPTRSVLAKPWTISELLVRVREILDEDARGG